jgi:arylsulfatase
LLWVALAPHSVEPAAEAQLDGSVGALMKALDDMGEANNTIVVFSTDNGAEKFTWPDGGMTPFRASKGTLHEGGFRVPAIIRWRRPDLQESSGRLQLSQ